MTRTVAALCASAVLLAACARAVPPTSSAPDDAAAGSDAPPTTDGSPSDPSTTTPSVSPSPLPTPSTDPTDPASTSPPPEPGGGTGTAEALGIRLMVPASWAQDPNQRHRWEGDDGFVEVDAAAGVHAAMDLCREQAEHRLQPYGSTPTIEAATVDGQEGCIVSPSDDQPTPMAGQGLAAVRYPAPLQVGGQTYEVAVVYAPVDRLRELLGTLRFTR